MGQGRLPLKPLEILMYSCVDCDSLLFVSLHGQSGGDGFPSNHLINKGLVAHGVVRSLRLLFPPDHFAHEAVLPVDGLQRTWVLDLKKERFGGLKKT